MVAYWSDVILSSHFVVASVTILSFYRLFPGERLFLRGISAVAAAFKNKKTPLRRFFVFMVGMTGFEPATPCTPCKCATRLRYIPTTKKFIKLSERKCKFFFSKMKNKFSINYGNVKNPGMRMQTGIKLKKLNFKFNHTTNWPTAILVEVAAHAAVGRSDDPRVAVVGAAALGRRPIKSIFLQTISGQTSGIKQCK